MVIFSDFELIRHLTLILPPGLELANEQNEEEDLSVLPTLRVSDIEPELKRTSLDVRQIGKKSSRLAFHRNFFH